MFEVTLSTTVDAPRGDVLTWRRVLAGWIGLAATWVAAFCVGIAALPPSVSWLWLPAIGAAAGSIAVVAHALRAGWASAWISRWTVPALAASLLAVLIWSRFYFYALQGWAEILVVLVSVPAAVVLVVIALVRYRRDHGSTLLTLATCALYFAAIWSGLPQPVASLRWRIEVFGTGDLEREGERALANPPRTRYAETNQPFVARGQGAAAVGWTLVLGLPAQSTGLAYDPHGAIEAGTPLETDTPLGIDQVWCEHLDGPWYWCKFA